MKTTKLKCSDGSWITEYRPETAEEKAEMVKQIQANPEEWDLGLRPEEDAIRLKSARKKGVQLQ